MGDIVNAGADLLGFGPASKQAGATRYAADIGARSQAEAIAAQREARDQQIALSEPYRQGGLAAQNKLLELLGIGGDPNAAGYGSYSKPFSMADYQADPGYGFRLGEGLKAMSHQAGARGGLISGQTMKGMEDYRQASASQEYGNAFNRYRLQRGDYSGMLGNQISSGQATAVGQANQAGQYGVNAGNLMMTGGANQANAALMQGNIGAQQFNTLGRGFNQAQSMYGDKINNLFGGGGNYNTQGIQQGYDPRGYGADFGGYAP